MQKVVVITGGSSGIGLATAIKMQKEGNIVYDLSRKKNESSDVLHIDVDVSNKEMIEDAIQKILSKENRIDIVINNAGYGISGATEFTSVEDAKRLLDVNFWGMVNVSNTVIPIMRNQKSGKIINISSIASITPIPFQTYYSVSKAAVNSYTMALANELKDFNIDVIAIMPGDIKTNFTASREKNIIGDKDVYCGRIARSVETMEKDEKNGMDTSVIAETIYKISNGKRLKPLNAIGIKYKFFACLVKLLPCKLTNNILYKMYAK